MKQRWMWLSLVMLMVLLAPAGNPSLAQEAPPEPTAQGEYALLTTVAQKISYQGFLTQDGNPMSGTADMIFRLYSDSTCTTLLDTINKPGTPVNDGYFDVELAVNQSDFNGQGVWVATSVGGTQVGCQEILPVPYALSLRPGAEIESELTISGRGLLNVSTSNELYRAGFLDTPGLGVLSVHGYNAGAGVAVYGQAKGSLASGVYGTADHSASYGGYFGNTGGGTALMVGGSGIIQSTAQTEIGISPHNMVASAGSSSSVELRPDLAYMEVRPTTGGLANVYVPVELPVTLFGTQTRLENVRICYRCDLATSYLAAVAVRELDDTGGSALIMSDATQHNSTSWECFDLTPATPYALNGPLTIAMMMNYSASGSGHDIRIGRITVTLSE